MPSESRSQADSEFKLGNFERASQLYAEELQALQNSECTPPDLAELLIKLADSDYAFANFEGARKGYEQAAALHAQHEFAAKDRVSTLLKLAKCQDKCGNDDVTAQSFQSAYDLANAELTPKNYLRRSVLDSYAQWLRATNRDPERLGMLEDELGIKKEEPKTEPADEPAESSVVQANIAAVQEKRSEQEFYVMKTKLTRRSKKEADAGDADSGDRSSESKGKSDKKSLANKGPKTIDQEVAERKFLRKGESHGSGDRAAARANLRNAMSRSRESRPLEVNDPSPEYAPSQVASGEFAPLTESVPAPDLSPAAKTGGDELPRFQQSPRYDFPTDFALPGMPAVDREAEEHAAQEKLAKFLNQKPARSLKETRKKRGVDLVIPSERTNIPENSKQFIQQAELIKKASDEPEQAPDLVPLRADGRQVDAVSIRQRLTHVAQFALPVILLGALVTSIVVAVQRLDHMAKTVRVLPGVRDMLVKDFATADGDISVSIKADNAELTGPGVNRQAQVKYWHGDFTDELLLLQGRYRDCHWLSVVPQGLQDTESGVMLYSLDSPERKVIEYMHAVASDALDFYKANKRFPGFTTDLTHQTYLNPFTKTQDGLLVFQKSDLTSTPANREQTVDLPLLTGGRFNGERQSHPGEVSALSMSSDASFNPDQNSYTWATEEFYIHGYDRDGRMIGGSGKGKIYLIRLQNGMQKRGYESQEYASQLASGEVCFTQSGRPKEGEIIARYLFCALLLLGLFAAVFIWQFSMARAAFRPRKTSSLAAVPERAKSTSGR